MCIGGCSLILSISCLYYSADEKYFFWSLDAADDDYTHSSLIDPDPPTTDLVQGIRNNAYHVYNTHYDINMSVVTSCLHSIKVFTTVLSLN